MSFIETWVKEAWTSSTRFQREVEGRGILRSPSLPGEGLVAEAPHQTVSPLMSSCYDNYYHFRDADNYI